MRIARCNRVRSCNRLPCGARRQCFGRLVRTQTWVLSRSHDRNPGHVSRDKAWYGLESPRLCHSPQCVRRAVQGRDGRNKLIRLVERTQPTLMGLCKTMQPAVDKCCAVFIINRHRPALDFYGMHARTGSEIGVLNIDLRKRTLQGRSSKRMSFIRDLVPSITTGVR